MIKYLKHEDIDKEKWDKTIRASFNGMIYAYSWWLDIVNKNWEALIENDYERVFPLTAAKKYGIHYIFQPYFTQQLGIFSRSILNAEIVDNFLSAIPRKFKLVEINLNTLNKTESNGFRVFPQVNHELDLIHSYDYIHKNYSQNTKRNLKKALNSGLTIVRNLNPEELINLFRHNRGRDVSNLKDNDYLILNRLIYNCLHKGKAELYGAANEFNEICGGAVFVKSNKKAIFLFSGLSEEGREKGAMFLIIDAFIREHAQNHLVFDFDGSNDPDLSRFYKSFGSNVCYYLRVTRNTMPLAMNITVKLVKKLRR